MDDTAIWTSGHHKERSARERLAEAVDIIERWAEASSMHLSAKTSIGARAVLRRNGLARSIDTRQPRRSCATGVDLVVADDGAIR